MREAQGSEGRREPGADGEVDREALAAFLATAPEGLQDWAAAQLARFDAEGTGEPEDAADVEDLLADDDVEDALAPSSADTALRRGRPSALERRTGVSRMNLVLVALLAAAVVIIVQQVGRGDTAADAALPSGHPSVAATADASAVAAMDEAEPVDAEREAELQAQAEADPANFEARQELGVMYLKAALYQDSITWLQQILDADPDNLDALLTIGVAEYQSNQYEAAETHWLRAAEIDPDVAEPWYNLGFLYLARTPPDSERATQCWEKVLQLAPDSEMAATVRGHVGTMGSATATPSAG
ncbi:TPR repeat-containing protein [Actinomyces ruminicola]|uniref:TPR repeat-containing protein n=1 Tax=Actinomyces ruminicola TaxID=332524 RepID=A0A1H0ENX4_9ACTO|nr:tetratricopeptide repeat protein [Actinomyces ruminicola]SDN84072.1 TPR repeat-containing protein [Actinomyces ruminicola]